MGSASDVAAGCERFCGRGAVCMSYERGPHISSKWTHPASPTSPAIISTTTTAFISTSPPAPAPSASAATTVTPLMLSYLVKTGPSVSLTDSTRVTFTGFAHFLFFLIYKCLWYACWVFLSLQQQRPERGHERGRRRGEKACEVNLYFLWVWSLR